MDLKNAVFRRIHLTRMDTITQNDLLLMNLLKFFQNENHLQEMLKVITGQSNISLRIVDWFATNYSKKHYICYNVTDDKRNNETRRFKVYNDYKLKLKAYSKKRFDPFCRWERINIPYVEDKVIETTIGQLNFFKWILENKIIQYIEENYHLIEHDMNCRNSISKKQESLSMDTSGKTRKKREELSVSATKSIKKEEISVVLNFH
jgi:hypothetical protein